MAEIIIDLKLKVSIPGEEVKVDNLLYQSRKFMTELYFGILKTVFYALEERAIAKLKQASPQRYVKNGRQSSRRQIRTAYGLFQYRLARIWDKQTRRTLTPLVQIIGLHPYCRCVKESAEGGMGLVCYLSYRRSVKETNRILGTQMSKSTLHRQVQEFAGNVCHWPDLKKVPYRFLMVDGTKVRLQEVDKSGHGKKVEMRWALASLGEKDKFDLIGIWIDKSWQDIRQDLNHRLNYSNLEVLFSDGGSGIEENLLDLGMRHQRCLWHGRRDFPYILYADKLKKEQQQPLKDKLKSIPAMNLKHADLEQLTLKDLPEVKRIAEKTEQGFEELIEILPQDKYPRARAYIKNLSRNVTTFFDMWFARESWIPLNTNAIESAFSRVKNRIWAIGKRWSETGLMNWLKVVVKKVFFPYSWDQLWAKYLGIDSTLKFKLIDISYQWL
jgi:hypothetical protein